jgi:hypothetical protein
MSGMLGTAAVAAFTGAAVGSMLWGRESDLRGLARPESRAASGCDQRQPSDLAGVVSPAARTTLLVSSDSSLDAVTRMVRLRRQRPPPRGKPRLAGECFRSSAYSRSGRLPRRRSARGPARRSGHHRRRHVHRTGRHLVSSSIGRARGWPRRAARLASLASPWPMIFRAGEAGFSAPPSLASGCARLFAWTVRALRSL